MAKMKSMNCSDVTVTLVDDNDLNAVQDVDEEFFHGANGPSHLHQTVNLNVSGDNSMVKQDLQMRKMPSYNNNKSLLGRRK